MRGIKIFAALAAVSLLLSLPGCGSPAIGDLKTITLSSNSTNLKGEGGTLQLFATGVYSTGTHQDLTARVTYNVSVSAAPNDVDVNGNLLPAPPQDVLLNSTGMMTAVAPFACTWTDTAAAGSTTATWAITGSYQVTATFGTVTSQPLFVTVASQTGNGPGAQCGP